MSFTSETYRVLIASPSDLTDERKSVTEAINEWNALHAPAEGVVLLPVKWETHAMPDTGIRPQEAINRQLVDECDLLIGMFWTKLGTNTGVAESGTVEEIDRVVGAGKPAMLYLSKRPVDPGTIDLKQHRKLKRFKDATFQRALAGSFSSPEQLKGTVLNDLTRRVRAMKQSQINPPVSRPMPAPAPVPSSLSVTFGPDGSLPVSPANENIAQWYAVTTIISIEQGGATRPHALNTILFVVFDRPVALNQVQLASTGKALPRHEVKDRSARHLVVAFEQALADLTLNLSIVTG